MFEHHFYDFSLLSAWIFFRMLLIIILSTHEWKKQILQETIKKDSVNCFWFKFFRFRIMDIENRFSTPRRLKVSKNPEVNILKNSREIWSRSVRIFGESSRFDPIHFRIYRKNSPRIIVFLQFARIWAWYDIRMRENYLSVFEAGFPTMIYR